MGSGHRQDSDMYFFYFFIGLWLLGTFRGDVIDRASGVSRRLRLT
jgi:hypothetical protein